MKITLHETGDICNLKLPVAKLKGYELAAASRLKYKSGKKAGDTTSKENLLKSQMIKA